MEAYIYQDNLTSSRLRTRFLQPDDAITWTEFFEDKDAIAFIPDFGLSSNEARAKYWIERQLTRYAEHRYGLQALIDIDTNQFIGQCGLLLQEVDGEKYIEVGYHIFKKYRGRGYAPEAARLFIDYAFQNEITSTVISIIDIHNLKSQRVAEKNGLNQIKQTKWSGMDVFIYQRVK